MLGWSARWMAAGAAAGATFMLVFFPDLGRQQRFEVQTGGGEVPGVAPVEGGRMVWSEAGDIWLYEWATGERRQLTADGEGGVDHLPRFRSPGRVTFVTHRPPASWVLRELDLSTGRARELAALEGATALDWSPDGETLAVYRGGGET